MAKDENDLRPHYFESMRLPLEIINVLPQPRKTFEEIEYLANDIAQKNLYNPLTVASFDREHCQDYVELVNHLWGTDFSMEKIICSTDDNAEIFYVLLAGERRYRACLHIRDIGCEQCHEKFGQGGCYERHFGDSKVDVRACVNILPLDAIFIQASENIHVRVPPHEEAKFYNLLFKTIRETNPRYSLSKFSRKVGRSPETIKHALSFCELPIKHQKYIEDGKISWGIGTEIARLHAQGDLNEEGLNWWITRAIVGNYKVPKFRKIVSGFLFEKNSGQISLFEQNQEEQLRRLGFKQAVQRNYIMAMHSFIHYLNRVYDLFAEGKLGKNDSPFSEKSPIKIFRKLIEIEEKILPHLKSFLSEQDHEKFRRFLQEAGTALSRLEK